MKTISFNYAYFPGKTENAATLVLLQGMGNDENTLGFAQQLDFGGNILSLRGNALQDGRYTFFRNRDIRTINEADLLMQADTLARFIPFAAQAEAFSTGNIIVAGYSKGATLAAALLLRYPGLFTAGLLYRPTFPFRYISTVADTIHKTPVFLSSGEKDFTVPIGGSEILVKMLGDNGHLVTHHKSEENHVLTDDDIIHGACWLQNTALQKL